MNYELVTREITNKDIGVECPFIPDDGEYDLFFSSLCQAINEFEFVESAVIYNNVIKIIVDKGTQFETLKKHVKPLIQGETYAKLRVVSFG